MGGCGHYRMIYPGLAINEPDVQVTIANDKYVVADHDVVVFQFPRSPEKLAMLEAANAAGITTIVEVDDNYWALHGDNPATKFFNPRSRQILSECCAKADMVTVSTNALGGVARQLNDHVRVLRNCIPASYFEVRPNMSEDWSMLEGRITMGWTGDPRWHPGDLNVMKNAPAKVCKDNGAAFLAIGSDQTCNVLSIPSKDGFSVGWSRDLLDYVGLVKRLSIGVVPLGKSVFNDSKSWLKGLEYAACGVPFVASPSPEYRLLHIGGPGLIATDVRDWMRHLRALVLNEPFYREVQEAGLAFAREQTYEIHAWRWAQAWRDAMNRKAHSVARTSR